MADEPILICYDGSSDAARGIEVAAKLLPGRHAVVLDIGPPLTPAESLAALSPTLPGEAFEQLNVAAARERATAGAELAGRAGFVAEARGGIAAPTWQGIVDVADELNAAVIVVGSRGLDHAHELVEGSLSHQLAEHAQRPLLLVPPLA